MSPIEQKVLDSIAESAGLSIARERVPAGQPRAENPLDMPHGYEESISASVAGKLRE